jgi:hypothetical protein
MNQQPMVLEILTWPLPFFYFNIPTTTAHIYSTNSKSAYTSTPLCTFRTDTQSSSTSMLLNGENIN